MRDRCGMEQTNASSAPTVRSLSLVSPTSRGMARSSIAKSMPKSSNQSQGSNLFGLYRNIILYILFSTYFVHAL